MRSRLARGIAAGLIGTASMTAVQELVGGSESSGEDPPSWENAPAPAKLGRRALNLVGFDVPVSWIPFLTHAMHWSYGTSWGVTYTLVRGDRSSGELREGVLFGAIVWAASYVALVPVGIYEPPWEYDAKTLATDIGYHLAFGVGTVAAADVL